MKQWKRTSWTATEGSAAFTYIVGEVEGVPYEIAVTLIARGNGQYARDQREPADLDDQLARRIETAIQHRITNCRQYIDNPTFLRDLPGSGITPLNSTETRLNNGKLTGWVRAIR